MQFCLWWWRQVSGANFRAPTIISVSKYFGNLQFVVSMLQLNGANFPAPTVISVSKYFCKLQFVVNIFQRSGAHFRAINIICVSKYFGNLHYRLENLWIQIPLSRRCPGFLCLFGVNYSGCQSSPSFVNLRFSVIYPNLHVRTGDMIGADVFQSIRVSF